MSRWRTGPEDPTPGQVLILTPDQLAELQDLVSRQRRGSVRLRDRGAAWVQAELLNADGSVARSWLLPPASAWEGHQSKLRRARERREQVERQRRSKAAPRESRAGPFETLTRGS
jgi:hypothetical protein